jgi:hypothetical protein
MDKDFKKLVIASCIVGAIGLVVWFGFAYVIFHFLTKFW